MPVRRKVLVWNDCRTMLLLASVFIGVTYAGIVNIMLNGLGIVLSPEENLGFFACLNTSEFNLGAGLSFAATACRQRLPSGRRTAPDISLGWRPER